MKAFQYAKAKKTATLQNISHIFKSYIPGTVKLWESPGRAGGFPIGIKLDINLGEVLTIKNTIDSLVAYSQLLSWCKEKRATLFQTQLLIYSDTLLLDIDRARKEMRERMALALARDNNNVIYHIFFDIQQKCYLGEITKKIMDFLKSRNYKIEAVMNLDVGSYNIMNIFNEKGVLLKSPLGPVPMEEATNLIIYTTD